MWAVLGLLRACLIPDLLPSIVCGTSLALENGDNQLNTASHFFCSTPAVCGNIIIMRLAYGTSFEQHSNNPFTSKILYPYHLFYSMDCGKVDGSSKYA